jgi:hypothetical protein
MSGVIFSDIVAVVIAKLQGILDVRTEPASEGARVADEVVAGASPMVTVEYAGGPGDVDTIDTTYLAIIVRAVDLAMAVDLARLVRAIATGRGPGTLCDGQPITHTAVNSGPRVVDNDPRTPQVRQVIEVRHRGTNL